MQKTAFQLIKGHLLKRKSMVFDLKISEFLSKNQRNKTIKQKNNTEYFSRIKKTNDNIFYHTNYTELFFLRTTLLKYLEYNLKAFKHKLPSVRATI